MTENLPTVHPNHDFITFTCGCCGADLTVPVSCGNRFCSICNKSRTSRLRKRVRYLMKRTHLAKGMSFKFLTLTIPNMQNAAEQLLLIQKSFRRLRQRKWWKTMVNGGCVFYEVKMASDGSYHIHLHSIVESKYIPVKQLSKFWSEVSPGSIVDIRWISNKAIINYITKYTTKSDLSLKSQLAATKLLKRCRLFQPFGSWHATGKDYKHDPYQCEHCKIADWIFVPAHMSSFDAMWDHGHEPIKIPDRIMSQFKTELDLESPQRHLEFKYVLFEDER